MQPSLVIYISDDLPFSLILNPKNVRGAFSHALAMGRTQGNINKNGARTAGAKVAPFLFILPCVLGIGKVE